MDTPPNTGFSAAPLRFLANGGAVGDLLQSPLIDGSPLGAPCDWPDCLKALMGTILPVQAQIALFWGPEFVALYNDAYAPSIGEKHPRALGRPAIENWRELWDDLEPLLRGVLETGQTFAAKDRAFYIERHGCGETVYFDVSYSAVRQSDGSVGGVLCVVTETTERVHFERRQALLLELGQALPSIRDPEQIKADVIRRIGHELGAARVHIAEMDEERGDFTILREYRQGDVTTRTGVISVSVETCSALRQGVTVQASARADSVFSDPCAVASRSDSAGSLAVHVPLMRHDTLAGVFTVEFKGQRVCSPHDIHIIEETAKLGWQWINHTRAESALHASSAQLAGMFEQAGAGIALCDHRGVFQQVNDRYCEIMGLQRQAIAGRSILQLQNDVEANAQPMFYENFLTAEAPFELTQHHVRTNGSVVWVQTHVTPLLDAQQQASGLLFVCVDISARVGAEHQLIELNESLEQRVATMVAEREAAISLLHESRKIEMVGQLGGGIAHDFNNLLTPIMTSLELLRRQPVSNDRSHRLIDAALQAADRARILVGRLLTFARRQTLKPQVVALNSLVNGMHDLIQRSLGPTIQVIVEIPADLPNILIDPHQLELGVLNLAVNARDAIAERGYLKISACPEVIADSPGLGPAPAQGCYVRLTVSDNGSGMNEEVLQRCVEPFYSTKGVGKGTGLGLSMVQGLALQSGGGFDIQSTPGLGTRVDIWLPVSSADALTPAEGEGDSAPDAHHPFHVLVVDDEELVRYTVALQLRDLGYRVTEAASPSAAEHMVSAGLRPDVLITDQLMAEKSGTQLALSLREVLPALPVLVVTGYTSESSTQIAGFDVLAKPFSRADIASKVAQVINQREVPALVGEHAGHAS
ncbi:PAS domain-containing protein [Pseudomonas sp. KU26590]|uniref:PAS domain-containing protein n=1 Tax=Pseudomonas sp. KU26590 TaxID=2991051 RepID=UPI00223D0D88|nr:PAS domain-containing protein [Pseudomonas sp. KU26590]UZJ58636.1 PAS domain-containing protein [Pseudomonas sp. KU26590]